MHVVMITCSIERPWGLHAPLRSDEDCPRCGWTAPGPVGDAREAEAFARQGWTDEGGEALAA